MNQKWVEITDPATLRVLLSEHAFEALSPFFTSARSLSEAAALLDWKMPRLSGWVKKLVGAGLLEVAHTQPRRGSAIRYYRTVAPAFYVPYAQHDPAVFEAFRERLNDRLEETLKWAVQRKREKGQGVYGLRIDGQARGGTRIAQVSALGAAPVINDPDLPPTAYRWDNLSLTAAEAREFNERINLLLEEYAARRGPQRYLVRLGFAQVDP